MKALLIFVVILNSNFVFANDGKVIASLSNEPIGVSNYIQMFFGLFIVVALVIGLAWLMRRMGNINGISSNSLKVIGGVSVGQRERVVLLQAGEKQLLLGVAPGTIRTLHVLEENILINSNSEKNISTGFAEKFQAAIKNRGGV